MKFLLVVLYTLLLGTHARAVSKYAGEYYAISSDYNPLRTGPKIVAGLNITVHGDGSLTGRGAYLDFTPITVTGEVEESGEITLVQISDGHRSTEKSQFEADGEEFFMALPSGLTLTGRKVSAEFPEAGIYHAGIGDIQNIIFFLHRDGSVFGIVFNTRGGLFDVAGQATSEGFSAISDDGATFTGEFDGTKISGGYSPNKFLPLEILFSGERY